MEYLVSFLKMLAELGKKFHIALDTNPETATFTTASMIPAYKDPGSEQWGEKIANNTAYNWRHSDRAIVIENEQFDVREERDYDTGRDYVGSYVFCWKRWQSGAMPLPFTITQYQWNWPSWLLLSTSYQDMNLFTNVEIKALTSGGIRIRNKHNTGQYYFTGSIFELRKVTGTLVP